MIRVLLITTTIYNADTEFNLNRLFESIKVDDNILIKHIVLVQGVKDVPTIKSPNFVDFRYIENVISLSNARNLMLENEMCNIEKYDFIGFPDDDCWYPYDNFLGIINFFNQNKLDYLVTKYRFENHDIVPRTDFYSSGYSVFKFIEFSSSITIFVSGKILKISGLFDEKLGVGAEFNGGEDLDYSIKSFYSSKRRCFLDLYLMAHKDRNTSNKVRYYEGSLFVFHKNKKFSIAIYFALIRKIFVGVYYVLTGKMTMQCLFKTFKKVFNER